MVEVTEKLTHVYESESAALLILERVAGNYIVRLACYTVVA